MQARTVKHTIELHGAGLHSGQLVRVRIKPNAEGRGIRFVRGDLPGAPAILSGDICHVGAPLRTVLRNGAAEVHTVEHLLSALAGLGVTDCEIEMDGEEVPGLDGSALCFADAIRSAGIVVLARDVAPIVVRERVAIQDGPASIEALPYDGFKVSYTLDYPGHALAQGTFEFEFSEADYLREIAPARTFAIRPEAEKMRAAGMGKGASAQNTVIIDGDKAVGTTLRFDNEPVRHKILDVIGDLYVLGRPIRAHVIAKYSGHRANRMLAHRLVTG
ncbi:MAG TPA: UDP-3-O-acyl-N-acetylglucosamine deacetylase [Planctomycetota bacterium]|nr:UDP-3-O-acyl-N-acetylglucosamine deacetylase [Planctomycetota bacterium]